MRSRSFFWAAASLAVLTVIFLAAGVWQLGRAQYKVRMQASVDAAVKAPALHAGSELLMADTAHLRRVEASGVWLAERTILLDNKVREGVVGYEVVTPLLLADSKHYLLVNRGWIKAPVLRSELPRIVTPSGPVHIEGLARVPSHRFIELGNEVVTGAVWQNLTIERYQAWSNLPLQPVLLYQDSAADDGLIRVDAAPEASSLSADRHRGYAFTWFSLAAVTVVLGLMGWRRSKSQSTS